MPFAFVTPSPCGLFPPATNAVHSAGSHFVRPVVLRNPGVKGKLSLEFASLAP